MGINVYTNAISEEITEIATSIEEVSGKRFSREDIILSLARNMLKKRSPQEVLSEYRKQSLTLGKKVEVRPHAENPYPAIAKEILPDYSLFVEKEDSECVRVFSGEVSTKIN
jgi:biotin-(acetyl-CoA carboxylase) ligase